MAVSIKICKQCKKDFEANEPRRRYCSHECQQAFLNANRKGKCKKCGKEFRGTKREYCSDECRGSTITPHIVTTNCITCGAPHSRNGKYCSTKCQYKNKNKAAGNTRHYSGTCQYCGKQYEKGGKKFCDKSCSAKYRVHVMGIVGGFGR